MAHKKMAIGALSSRFLQDTAIEPKLLHSKAMVLSGVLLSAGLVWLSPVIVSDANGADFKQRFYIGANVGFSQLEPDTSDVSVTVDEKNDLGFGLSAGMDISNRISVELHANDLGTATLSPSGEIDYSVYGLSALFYGLNSEESRELREDLSGFLRLGVGSLSNSANVAYERENDFNLLLGVGAEYGMVNGLAFRGELIRFYSDAHYLSLGVLYRFGEAYQAPQIQAAPEAPMFEEQVISEPIPAPVPVPQPVVVEPEDKPVDQDLDGVMDDVDQCLNSKIGAPVNASGCALFDGVMEGVTFESASATLTPEAQQVLDKAAAELLNYPDIRVAVMAHTDNQGDAGLNLELSKQRSIAVVRYLLRRGVPLNRLRAEAYGEKRPIASNETAEGRQRNRRVEFKVLK